MLKCFRWDEILPKARFTAKQLKRTASTRFCIACTSSALEAANIKRKRAGQPFLDIMTGDILSQFVHDQAFFRIGILCKELRAATRAVALALEARNSSLSTIAWRLTHAPAYHTRCTSCMQYVLRQHLCTRQRVCGPSIRACEMCGVRVEQCNMPGPRKQVCRTCWNQAMDSLSCNEWARIKHTL